MHWSASVKLASLPHPTTCLIPEALSSCETPKTQVPPQRPWGAGVLLLEGGENVSTSSAETHGGWWQWASPASLLPTTLDSVYPTTSVPAQPIRCGTRSNWEQLRAQWGGYLLNMEQALQVMRLPLESEIKSMRPKIQCCCHKECTITNIYTVTDKPTWGSKHSALP